MKIWCIEIEPINKSCEIPACKLHTALKEAGEIAERELKSLGGRFRRNDMMFFRVNGWRDS